MTKVSPFKYFSEFDHKVVGVQPLKFVSEEDADFDILYESLGIPK